MIETEHEEEIALFAAWLANFFGSNNHPLPLATGNLLEVKTMLATKLKLIELEWLERGREEGKEKGIEEGKAKGIEEGIEKGIEEGHRDAARRLKMLGAPLDLIEKATGLSPEEIERL